MLEKILVSKNKQSERQDETEAIHWKVSNKLWESTQSRKASRKESWKFNDNNTILHNPFNGNIRITSVVLGSNKI